MAHTIEEKKRLLNRVRRIMGQVAAIERSLDQEGEYSEVLHNISACRGAMDALMAEVIEGHIRFHVLPHSETVTDEQERAADDLVTALRPISSNLGIILSSAARRLNAARSSRQSPLGRARGLR